MKFSCEKGNLLEKILIAHDIISAKSTISILANVLLTANENTLFIQATDIKVSFSSSLGAYVKDPGTAVVYCDRLLEILRVLPEGEIDFCLDENMLLSIVPQNAKTTYKLKCIAADKYPPQPTIEEGEFIVFPQRDFIEMITQTIFAISDDETRFYLNGVYLEKNADKINMVATDGRRLALVVKDFTHANAELNGCIIPPKILNIVKKYSIGEGNLKIAVKDKIIFIKTGDYLFTSTLLEGKFPNYQKIIPEETTYKVILDRKQFEEAIKRVSILIENKTKSIFFQLKTNTMLISSEESEIGKAQDEINCHYGGPEILLVFNYNYILEPLRVINDPKIELDFNDAQRTVILKPLGSNNYLNIIMPLQTND